MQINKSPPASYLSTAGLLLNANVLKTMITSLADITIHLYHIVQIRKKLVPELSQEDVFPIASHSQPF